MAVAEAPLSAIPGIPDDLPNTVTAPPGATAPLPARTLEDVYDGLTTLSCIMDDAFARLSPLFEAHERAFHDLLAVHHGTLSASEASALHDLCDTLRVIQTQGLQVLPAPYSATVQVRMPSGYAVALTIVHREGGTFLEALAKLEGWLQSAQYTPVTP